MKRKIILTNSTEKALVDEGDYDLVNARNWHLDGKHVYTKVMVPIDDPASLHKSYPLKIRMDRYIYRLTTHNFVRIRHWGDDPLNNCRSEILKEPTAAAQKTRGMTRWLGVKNVKDHIKVEYKNKAGIVVRDEFFKITRTADPATRLNTESKAARLYDKWAIEAEGPQAKTNFLPGSIYK